LSVTVNRDSEAKYRRRHRAVARASSRIRLRRKDSAVPSPRIWCDSNAVCLGNQATSSTTRASFFNAVCWQFSWHSEIRRRS